MRKLFAARARADFWPPRPSRFWQALLAPVYRRYARKNYRIAEIVIESRPDLWQRFAPGDSVLVAPNHTAHADAHVMMQVGRRLGQPFYFMAACEIFALHGGLDGWILQ